MAIFNRMTILANRSGLRASTLLRRIAYASMLGVGLSATPVRADYFVHFWEDQEQSVGSFRLGLDLTDYSTGSNYDPTGNVVTPAGFGSVGRFTPDLSAAIGITDRIGFFGRISWTTESVNQISSGANASSTSYGFADQTLGANWRVWEATKGPHDHYAPSLDIQIQGDFPAYSNSQADTTHLPHIGDQSLDTTTGAFLSIPFGQNASHAWLATAGAGFTFRTGGFSSAIPWSVMAKFVPEHAGFLADASVLGNYSMKTDVNTPPSTDLTSTAGSVISGAVNPSLMTVRGKLGYQFDNDMTLSASYFKSLWGQDAPVGWGLVLGVQMTFNPGKKSTPGSHKKTEYDKKNAGFQNYTLDAKVLRTNDRLNLIKIDKGTQEGIEVGNIFDIFVVKADGSVGEAIARAEVTSVKFNEAALNITDYFKEVWIEEGFVAKRLIQP